MANRYFKMLSPDGTPYTEVYDFDHSDPVTELPGFEGWTLVAETTRLPNEFEAVQDDGTIIEDVVTREDTRAGQEHIKLIRVIKASEAAMVLSGITLTEGILFREAQALGIPILTLAQQVRQQLQPFYLKEIERRKAKLGIP